MPRKPLLLTENFPYHVSARSNNREWFAVSQEECWEIFSDYLYFINITFRVRIHAFVLMSNHYHLVLTTPEANLPEVMNRFMTEVSRRINSESSRINHVFGGRYKATLIENHYYFGNVMKYVYRNPVEAGICRATQDYRWSSLHGLLGRSKIAFPILDSKAFPQLPLFPPADSLDWLNQGFMPDHLNIIRQNIRKTKFGVCSKRTSDAAAQLGNLLC